jgi:predicted lipoprotein
VQQHVTVGMSQQPEFVCNTHAAQGNEIAFSETVHIVAVANTHKKTPRFCQGVILPALTAQGACVMAQVVFDEAGDEVVAVVVARLQAQGQRMTRRLAACCSASGLSWLARKSSRSPWSTSNGSFRGLGDQRAGIPLAPRAVFTQVAEKAFWPHGQSIGLLIGENADTDR